MSFSALEKAKMRDASRLTPDDIKPPEVQCLNDIRSIVAEYNPETAKDGEQVLLRTHLKGEDESGKQQTYVVSAVTRSKSRRTMLLEGFDVLRRQAEVRALINERVAPITVNGRGMLPPKLSDNVGAIYIDPLIRQWMGAERRQMLICWDLQDGYTYSYSIYEHKLTRVKRGDECDEK